jgi:O-antigen/teichoic acid export membrane protein
MRGAAMLTVRQGAVSLITFGGVLALAALLTPADFALYGYVTTVILVAAAVGDLGLGAGLIKGEATPRDLRGSFALQLIFWIPFCTAMGVIGAAAGVYGFSTETMALLAAALLLLSLQALPTALLERRMAFGSIALLETLQRAVFIGGAVLLAVFAPSQASIPLAAACAGVVGYLSALVISGWRWRPRFARGEPLFRGFSSDWWQGRIANQLTYAAYPLLGGILFSGREVGLIVWALAISSVPSFLAPTVARAVFPAIVRTGEAHQTRVYSRLFKAMLLVGLPITGVMFACAEPMTRYLFGGKWLDAVPLLRLESVTTVVGLALTPVVPLLFVVLPVRRVKWMMVASTASLWVLAPSLSQAFSFKAISIATIIVTVTLAIAFDRMLAAARGYSLLRDMLPGLAGVAVGVAVGLPAATMVHGVSSTLLLCACVGSLCLGVTVLLGGGVDPRLILRSTGRIPISELTPDVP